ncbi:hypothetical protein L210DRAFT_3557635 [Boletus edulis BED1]|uniref:Secreted protein n=1 Tax=Boletus edulis BED1 TaxID=1328754 RepID=A0AAD4G738_BOLED|nr:hypothetical protein L210DRAFT_3567908 [Boletus edulis BED1]KAF8432700.1 hypothetical protein L210DRAFT_3557635 [Boletus edulis BED1]
MTWCVVVVGTPLQLCRLRVVIAVVNDSNPLARRFATGYNNGGSRQGYIDTSHPKSMIPAIRFTRDIKKGLRP